MGLFLETIYDFTTNQFLTDSNRLHHMATYKQQSTYRTYMGMSNRLTNALVLEIQFSDKGEAFIFGGELFCRWKDGAGNGCPSTVR